MLRNITIQTHLKGIKIKLELNTKTESPKILIVEDEVLISLALRNNLENSGYTVTSEIRKGEDVLPSIDSNRPDLILMDINLSGKYNGLETAEIVGRKYSIPIVFLTSYSDEKHVSEARCLFPYTYLEKSVSPHILELTINSAIHKFKLEEKLQEASSLIEASKDAVISIDLSGKVRLWNPGAEKLFGCPAETAAGKAVLEIITPLDRYLFQSFLMKATEKQHSVSFNLVQITESGKNIDVALTVSPIFNIRGIMEGTSIIAREVTEQKAIERRFFKNIENRTSSIANYLQENLVQSLTGAALRLKNLEDQLSSRHTDLSIQAASIKRSLNDNITYLRNFFHDQAIVDIGSENFIYILNGIVSSIRGITGTDIKFFCIDDPDILQFDNFALTQLSKIFQEVVLWFAASMDTWKLTIEFHADIDKIDITLSYQTRDDRMIKQTLFENITYELIMYRTYLVESKLSVNFDLENQVLISLKLVR